MSWNNQLYTLQATKDGVTKFCTAYWASKEVTTLKWEVEHPDPDKPIKKCSFVSKDQAWYIWYQWKTHNPDLAEGWKPKVCVLE